jgi:signal peptidase I
MKEKIATVVVYASFFVIGWLLLYVWTSFGYKQVEGNEMLPTLRKDAFKFVSIPDRKTSAFSRGDMVAFIQDGVVKRRRTFFAGRVIAHPGDRVRVENGTIFVNDERLTESYIKASARGSKNLPEIMVPRGCLYIAYDNRQITFQSLGGVGIHVDSRELGPIGVWAIIGRF